MLKLLATLILAACVTQPAVKSADSPPVGVTWVTDTHNNAVRIYQGTALAQTVTLPPNSFPVGVAVGADGNARIAYSGDNLVVTMDASGNVVSSFDVPHPTAVTYDPAGNLWVAVNTSPQAYAAKYNATGDVVQQVFTPVVSGQDFGIWGLAVDSAGDVFMDLTNGAPGGYLYVCPPTVACIRINPPSPSTTGLAFRTNLYGGFGFFVRQYASPSWNIVEQRKFGVGQYMTQPSVNGAGTLYMPILSLGVYVKPLGATTETLISDPSAYGAAGD